MPQDKRPPRNLWDKPWRLAQFLDEVFDRDKGPKKETYVEFDAEEVE